MRRTLPIFLPLLLIACATDAATSASGDATVLDAALPDAEVSTDASSLDAAGATCRPFPMRGSTPPCRGAVRTVMGRAVCVYVPSSIASAATAPVMLLIHGYNANGQEQADYFDFDALADRHGFILVKPDGTENVLGSLYWNASAACCAPRMGTPPDDVAFLGAVLDDVQSALHGDPTRTYVVGHSNGAFMAHRLACDLSARLAAVVSLAGAVDPDACMPSEPISLVEVHGTSDAVIHYEGGTLPQSTTPYPSVDATMTFWAGANGCDASPTTVGTTDLVCDDTTSQGSVAGAETTIERWSGCRDGVALEHWRMDGAGHIPGWLDPSWGEAVWSFLSSHHR